MIFVTVGTQDVAFDRLLIEVEKQIKKGNINEEVIAQVGVSKFKSDLMTTKDYFTKEEYTKLIKKSRLVITHAGVGTIIDSLNAGKVVIACPRLKKYKEHINDHQLQIVKELSNMGYIIPLKDSSKMANALKEAEIFKPKKYKSNTENMVKLIEDFIDKN